MRQGLVKQMLPGMMHCPGEWQSGNQHRNSALFPNTTERKMLVNDSPAELA